MTHVVCIGETMAALSPYPLGPLTEADLLNVDIAGAESNVASYLAAHGIRATWLSAVGDDPFGRRILSTLTARGVDTSSVRIDPTRPTGVMFKDPGPAGTRVRYYRQGSAASALGPDLLTTPALHQATLIHLTGITPALSQTCRALAEQALAPSRPHQVSFDVNYRPALWSAPRTAAATLLALARCADIVLVGLDEAQALWGENIKTPGDVRALLPAPHTLVVKDGGHAATAFTTSHTDTVPALPVEVVEPVGAGDAFAAGFLTGLLRGEPPRHALRLGHLTAASALLVASDLGPLLSATELEAFLTAPADLWPEIRLGANSGPPAARSDAPVTGHQSPGRDC